MGDHQAEGWTHEGGPSTLAIGRRGGCKCCLLYTSKPDADLIPSLMATSDVLGTGWFGAVAAGVGKGSSVAVVGDGAVGLMAVLAAKQLGCLLYTSRCV